VQQGTRGIKSRQTVYKKFWNVPYYSQGITEPVAPRISGPLKYVRHVAYCRPSRFNGIPRLLTRVTLFGVNDAPQMAQQEWERVITETTRLLRFVLFIDLGSSCRNTAMTSQAERTGAPSCRVANGTSAAGALIVQREIVNRWGRSSQDSSRRKPITPVQTFVGNFSCNGTSLCTE
jgi:hypothetical protein